MLQNALLPCDVWGGVGGVRGRVYTPSDDVTPLLSDEDHFHVSGIPWPIRSPDLTIPDFLL
jgi:hypothetical protein